MAPDISGMRQFRIERGPKGIVHLVFDAPGRSMNVFSNEAIHELAAFTRWLRDTDEVAGVLIRSGKESAFCVGADLSELGVAYDMIMSATVAVRFNTAYEHFFPLSAAIRALESSGKPVAVAIGGLALGGGCELAMGAHYRVLADTPKAALGLPESLVGLLPGGGGTQRLPRLIGLAAALPVLLGGARLAGSAALESGLVNELAPAGEEVAAAERWLANAANVRQPWDRPEWHAASSSSIHALIAPMRQKVIDETLGHYPAPLAILDCLEFGLPQCFEGAIRSEMAIFANLIQRAEPRNMIQSLFLAKGDYERLAKRAQLPQFTVDVVETVRAILAAHSNDADALARAGFPVGAPASIPARTHAGPGYWLDETGAAQSQIRLVLEEISANLASLAAVLSADEQRLADYAAIRDAGFPAYLGGPFAFRRRDLTGAAAGRTTSSR
jgi:3-hydroxyacyl-CoA dehydrogenase / enoyl-CoA hydratase / 3-hydroxybutyryl-CoA epimerase